MGMKNVLATLANLTILHKNVSDVFFFVKKFGNMKKKQ